MDVPELRDAIKQGAERLERIRRQARRLGEQNTKASLIEPIIEALGWDIRDPDEVHREYRRRGIDNPVDYALLDQRKPCLLTEAKGLDENLDDPRWASQMISYGTVAGVQWVVLTNGAEWRIYNTHAPVPVEEKLFQSVHIDSDVELATDVLGLLSKDCMRQDLLGKMWQRQYVDRLVLAELTALFASNGPASDLVTLLGRRLPRLNPGEIHASLTRATATFAFPAAHRSDLDPGPVAPAPPTATGQPATAAPSSSARRSAPRRAVTAEERRIRVYDMITAGRLRPGATLYGDYLGRTHQAELLPDGQVRYHGNTYPSLSAAGRAVKAEAQGKDTPGTGLATDGMDFWRTADARTGDMVTIKEIRRRVAVKSPPTPGEA